MSYRATQQSFRYLPHTEAHSIAEARAIEGQRHVDAEALTRLGLFVRTSGIKGNLTSHFP